VRTPAVTLAALFCALLAGCAQQVVVPGPSTPPPTVSAAAGETEVLAEGVSAFSGGWDTTRDHALSDALRKAVEQGVGVFIDSETRVQNFQLLSDRIYSRARGYVSSYRIIHEEQSSDMYRVVVRALVNSEGIENDLAAIGLLLSEQGRPRVMVVVREMESTTSLSAANAGALGSMFETQLLEGFRRKGFPVVDAATTARVLERDQLLLILEGDERTAALVGLEAGAEIIVSGTALRSRESRSIAGSPREIHIFQVNSRAINTRTAAVLAASATTTEVPFSESQARSQASEKTADQLITSILDGWAAGENITVIVATNADFQKLSELRSRIRTGIRGVRDVVTRDFTGSRATLEVVSETSTREVIEGLTELGGGFTVTGLAGNRMEIRFTD
jgi:hypothetical protein